MVIECATCGTRVPAQVALERTVGTEVRRFCSARCAEAGGAGAAPEGRLAPPRHLLVAVDGSGPALRAVEMAAALAAATGGEVHLLQAIDFDWLRIVGAAPVGIGPLGAGLRVSEIQQALRDEAEAQLAACRRVCEHAGVPVSSRAEFARPIEAILAAAEKADLVLMGSRGRGAVSGAILGSVSQRVIAGTRTPVLVVH